jgi:hypothetical protein
MRLVPNTPALGPTLRVSFGTAFLRKELGFYLPLFLQTPMISDFSFA